MISVGHGGTSTPGSAGTTSRSTWDPSSRHRPISAAVTATVSGSGGKLMLTSPRRGQVRRRTTVADDEQVSRGRHRFATWRWLRGGSFRRRMPSADRGARRDCSNEALVVDHEFWACSAQAVDQLLRRPEDEIARDGRDLGTRQMVLGRERVIDNENGRLHLNK